MFSFALYDNIKLPSCEANFTNEGLEDAAIQLDLEGGRSLTSSNRTEITMKTKVKQLRTAMELTQQQLADKVHVSARTIISIEKEQYSPSLMLAYRMAQVFGVTVEELCCLEENKRMEDEAYEKI